MAFDEFVDNLFVALLNRYSETGEIPDCSQLPEPVRIVILVYQCIGVIGNGGFRLILSGDFDGDPGYQLSFDGFRKIGANGAVRAFDRVFDLFDQHKFPTCIEERLAVWDANFSRFDSGTPDTDFFSAGEETIACLRTYVDKNLAFLTSEANKHRRENLGDSFSDEDEEIDEIVNDAVQQWLRDTGRIANGE